MSCAARSPQTDSTHTAQDEQHQLFSFWFQANASEQRGTLLPREKQKAAYDAALVERYQHLPEIKRIVRHRHLPSAIYKVG